MSSECRQKFARAISARGSMGKWANGCKWHLNLGVCEAMLILRMRCWKIGSCSNVFNAINALSIGIFMGFHGDVRCYGDIWGCNRAAKGVSISP